MSLYLVRGLDGGVSGGLSGSNSDEDDVLALLFGVWALEQPMKSRKLVGCRARKDSMNEICRSQI